MYLLAGKALIIGAEIVPLLIVVGPSLIAPNELLSEILLTFLPVILISGSSKVIEILVEEYPELDDYFEVKDSEDVSFLLQLQMCHDNSCTFNHRFAPDKVPADVFKQQLMVELEDFAETYGLNCE